MIVSLYGSMPMPPTLGKGDLKGTRVDFWNVLKIFIWDLSKTLETVSQRPMGLGDGGCHRCLRSWEVAAAADHGSTWRVGKS